MTFWVVQIGTQIFGRIIIIAPNLTEMVRKIISSVGANASSNVFVNMCLILTGRQPVLFQNIY